MVVIGSARHDELGNYRGGKSGDQLQKFVDDFKGEVSMQYLKDFVGKRKWYIIRLKDNVHAYRLGLAMKMACNNKNIGYDQNNRFSIMTHGVEAHQVTECDCSSLVRACIKWAVGLSVPNFTTLNEVEVLKKTSLVKEVLEYRVGVKIYEGDIFVTTTKGHTGIAVDGEKRTVAKTVYKYAGVDYSKVFDPVFYCNSNPDVKMALGTNENVLFNHFILFGINEKSRVGKTKAGFNVEVYGTHAPDLLKVFGECKEGNYAPFYKHYCTDGFKENRRVI